jgi:hypothetical protein
MNCLGSARRDEAVKYHPSRGRGRYTGIQYAATSCYCYLPIDYDLGAKPGSSLVRVLRCVRVTPSKSNENGVGAAPDCGRVMEFHGLALSTFLGRFAVGKPPESAEHARHVRKWCPQL